jgi:N-acetylmuramoyl-L-alanine amidase
MRRARLLALVGLVLPFALGLQSGFCQAQAAGGAPPLEVITAVSAPGARDGIARVALAEAANQGDSGLLAVVHTILNRVADRRWGRSVDQVLNARAQFEPVLRAGGDWRALPPPSPVQRARIDTLINLVLEGRAPDLTAGALYFQNPAIVAARAASGQVSPALVHFGGRTPSLVIGDHAFYPAVGGSLPPAETRTPPPDPIFVPKASPGARTATVEAGALVTAPARGIFVLVDGQAVESRR